MWTLPKVILLIAAILGGCCLFIALFVLQATMSFWTVETLEVMNSVTDGGVQASQYPLTIYRPWFQRFFTMIAPLACLNYFPGLAILGRADPLGTSPLFHWISPIAGFVFLFLSLQVWKFGVRHYCSTGS
jgi:ABC-2 type transport system permease protein